MLKVTRDAQAHGIRLAGNTAAADVCPYIELILQPEDAQRLLNAKLPVGSLEVISQGPLVISQGPLVDKEVAAALRQDDARRGGLPSTYRYKLPFFRHKRMLDLRVYVVVQM